MLILSRKPTPAGEPGDTIYIGDNIAITVLSVSGSQVRIGIQAPKHVNVIRDDAKHGKREERKVIALPMRCGKHEEESE